MMTYTRLTVVALLLLVTQSALAASVRTSNLSNDPIISGTLYSALKASAGTVAQIKADGSSFVLAANLDQLSCSVGGCSLNWDTSSPTYPQDAGVFSGALYAALTNWAVSASGANDPALHRVQYPQTGSVRITLSDSYGSNDQVECDRIKNGFGNEETECTLVVSDIVDGATPDLQALYTKLLSAPGYIPDQANALLATVSTAKFSTPGKPFQIESIHTLYTDLLEDGYSMTGYYSYVTPILDSSGTVASDGITLAVTGSVSALTGAWGLQSVQAASYVLSHPIPPSIRRAK